MRKRVIGSFVNLFSFLLDKIHEVGYNIRVKESSWQEILLFMRRQYGRLRK